MRTTSLLLLSLAITACGSAEPEPVGSETPYLNEIPMLPSMFSDTGAELPSMVDIPNFTILNEQVSGGGYITADQVATLPAKGYTTIINLRHDGERGVAEEVAAAERAGLHYVSVPVGGGDFTLEDAKKVSDAIAAAPGHVLLHCASGGRVSAVWALTRALDEGLTPGEAAHVAQEEGCRPIPESMVERVRTELLETR